MKIINARYEFVKEPNITRKIERIARICYKSEDKIADGTDIKMLKNLISRQHMAMLEHGDIALVVNQYAYDIAASLITDMERHGSATAGRTEKCYLRLSHIRDYIISGNVRAWFNFFTYALKYEKMDHHPTNTAKTGVLQILLRKIIGLICAETGNIFEFDTEFITSNAQESLSSDIIDILNDNISVIRDYSVLTSEERMLHETFSIIFTCDRGVSHELVRMRDSSFAQESTRYCNYSQNKFSNEITVIKPCFDWSLAQFEIWKDSCEHDEKTYFKMLNSGATPQEARDNLPQSVKCDIAVTTNLAEWRHIFELRACDKTGPAHPQMKELCCPLCAEMKILYPFAFDDLIIATK